MRRLNHYFFGPVFITLHSHSLALCFLARSHCAALFPSTDDVRCFGSVPLEIKLDFIYIVLSECKHQLIFTKELYNFIWFSLSAFCPCCALANLYKISLACCVFILFIYYVRYECIRCSCFATKICCVDMSTAFVYGHDMCMICEWRTRRKRTKRERKRERRVYCCRNGVEKSIYTSSVGILTVNGKYDSITRFPTAFSRHNRLIHAIYEHNVSINCCALFALFAINFYS